MRHRSLVLLCVACCWLGGACGDDGVAKTVGTGNSPGDDEDAGGTGVPTPPAAARGDTPRWPIAEDEIELPYGAGDVSTDLSVEADLSELDVHMNVDTTASISEEIDSLQQALRGTLVTTLERRVPDVSFGVSRFADFPVIPFGVETEPTRDRPFTLLTAVTSDLSRVSTAVARLDSPLGFGGDEPEAGAESLYQVATGEGYEQGRETLIAAWDHDAAHGGGSLGGVGFRDLSLRIVLHVTDARSHSPEEYTVKGLLGTHSMQQAAAALAALSVRAIAIMSTDCTTATCRDNEDYKLLRAELSQLALTTNAIMEPEHDACPTGIEGKALPTYHDTCPLVFDVRSNGSGLATTVVDAVLGLLDRLRFTEVHAEVGADPLGLVRSVEAISVKQPSRIDAPKRADRLPSDKPDGTKDTFLAVQRRALLGFRVTLRNDRLLPSDQPQRFRVSIRVVGDGVAREERTLRIVVPAGVVPGIAQADAGPALQVDASTQDDAGQ